jgi:hypothetical protein
MSWKEEVGFLVIRIETNGHNLGIEGVKSTGVEIAFWF